MQKRWAGVMKKYCCGWWRGDTIVVQIEIICERILCVCHMALPVFLKWWHVLAQMQFDIGQSKRKNPF